MRVRSSTTSFCPISSSLRRSRSSSRRLGARSSSSTSWGSVMVGTGPGAAAVSWCRSRSLRVPVGAFALCQRHRPGRRAARPPARPAHPSPGGPPRGGPRRPSLRAPRGRVRTAADRVSARRSTAETRTTSKRSRTPRARVRGRPGPQLETRASRSPRSPASSSRSRAARDEAVGRWAGEALEQPPRRAHSRGGSVELLEGQDAR